jgi:hypothetical protein
VRNPARERSRNLNREVWESPSVYGGEDVKDRDGIEATLKWEWIPADAPDSCDWFPWEVIGVKESEDDSRPVSCRIRFQNG